MIDVFKFKSVSQDNFLALRVNPRTVYFGEVTYKNEKGETCQLHSTASQFEEVIGNPKVQKDRNGFGVQLTVDDSGKIVEKMEGLWTNNCLQGACNIRYSNGAEYQGKLVNGHREGFGKLILADGTTYQGFWRNDCMEGPGVFESAHGQANGNFLNNLFVGQNGSFVNPFVSTATSTQNSRFEQSASLIRENNIHAKNFRLLETNSVSEAVRFAHQSFKNDRYCFVVAEVNSGWSLSKLIRELPESQKAIIDCQKLEHLIKTDKPAAEQYSEEIRERLDSTIQKGGVVLLDIDEPSKTEHRRSLDADFKSLVANNKSIECLLNIKKLRQGSSSVDCCVLIYSQWRLPRSLRTSLVRQQVNNRFQYVCNVNWGDIVKLV